MYTRRIIPRNIPTFFDKGGNTLKGEASGVPRDRIRSTISFKLGAEIVDQLDQTLMLKKFFQHFDVAPETVKNDRFITT